MYFIPYLLGVEESEEFVLDVIVERKEIRDLSGSIIDKRYSTFTEKS